MDLSHWMLPALDTRPLMALCVPPDFDGNLLERRILEIAEAGFGGAVLEIADGLCQKGHDDGGDGGVLGAGVRALAYACEAIARAGVAGFALWLDDARHAAGCFLREQEGRAVGQRLRIERLLSSDDARQQAERADVLGVYCLSLRDGQSINGMERWTDESEASTGPLGRDDLLVAVSTGNPVEQDLLARLSLLDKEVSRGFIQTVWEPLRSELGQQIERGMIRGIRFSIPRLHGEALGSVVWSGELPKLFAERFGEDPVDRLPLLWFDGPGASRFRWRFRSVVADMFRENFLDVLSEWCEESLLRLTLSTEADRSALDGILHGYGPTARFFQGALEPAARPGKSLILMWEATSAANQQGLAGGTMLLMGAEPRTASLEEVGSLMDAGLCAGAVSAIAGRMPLSLEGNGKRLDGGRFWHPAQPWWEGVGVLNASFGRIMGLLRQGARAASVLVLSPSDSLMAMANNRLPGMMSALAGRRGINLRAEEIAQGFLSISQALSAYQIGFDIGDEETIARKGRAQANAFIVGRAEYTTVVVPPALSWRSSTMRLLRRFARKGGSIIAPQPLAAQVDFEPSRALEELAEECPTVYLLERSGRAVSVMASRLEPPRAQFRVAADQSAEGAAAVQRQTEAATLLFVRGDAYASEMQGRIQIARAGAVRCYDPLTPRIGLLETREERGAQVCSWRLSAGSSALFCAGGEPDAEEARGESFPRLSPMQSLGDAWDFERTDPNLVPLHWCRVAVGGEPLSAVQPMPVVRAMLRQQLASRRAVAPGDDALLAELIFEFESQVDGDAREVFLAMEIPEQAVVSLNDTSLEIGQEAWFLESALKRMEVGERLREGRNRLVVQAPLAVLADRVESPLLGGDFAVTLDGWGYPVLTAEPAVLRNGNFVLQGYPFYAGRMRLRQAFDLVIEEGKRYFLTFPSAAGGAIWVRLGEQEPAIILHKPFALEITRLARNGENRVEVNLAASLYNLFGTVYFAESLRGNPNLSPDEKGIQIAKDIRLWLKQPALEGFGLPGGAAIESFDPSTPEKVDDLFVGKGESEATEVPRIDEKAGSRFLVSSDIAPLNDTDGEEAIEPEGEMGTEDSDDEGQNANVRLADASENEERTP